MMFFVGKMLWARLGLLRSRGGPSLGRINVYAKMGDSTGKPYCVRECLERPLPCIMERLTS